MHAHCLHWLMSTGPLFQSTFYSDRPCKFMNSKIMPIEGSIIWHWGPDIAPTDCQYTCSLSSRCSGILAHCEYMWMS